VGRSWGGHDLCDGSDDPVVLALMAPGEAPLVLPWRRERHPRRVNPAYPEPDRGLRLRPTERWLLAAWEQTGDDPEALLQALGTVAVEQYLRWQGADAAWCGPNRVLVGTCPVWVVTDRVLEAVTFPEGRDWREEPVGCLAVLPEPEECCFFCALSGDPGDDGVLQLMGWATGAQIWLHGRDRPELRLRTVPYRVLQPPNHWPISR
jgi:hypothetical protein